MQPVNAGDRGSPAPTPPEALGVSPTLAPEGAAKLTPALVVQGVWAGYNHLPVLEDISFEVAKGDILGIIGPNGSGKSTLFKAILGLVDTWRGQIHVLGQPGTRNRHRIGYMPQMEQVDWDFPVTASDVTLMGRYARRGLFHHTNRQDREAAANALERVGIYQLRQHLIGELSGGERRRVLLARALANDPDLLLLDEPMAGLDATAQHQLLDIIDGLRDEGATIVLSTHDLSCVSGRCDKAACLNRRLIAYGAPWEILNEEILGETFGTHLLLVHLDGQAYAYKHHSHEPAAPVEPDGDQQAAP